MLKLGRVAGRFWLLGVFAAANCATQGAKPLPPRAFQPPPKPGSSITHTQLCRCRTCNPTGCCSGPDEDPGAACETRAESSNPYDFGSCGVEVQSCTSRCGEMAWRIPLTRNCEDDRPEQCCPGA